MAIRIGVIGTGMRMQHVLRLVLGHAPEAAITALCDPDPASIAAARRHLAAKAAVCATAEELCRRGDVDWVFIGSWNCFHAEQAIAALQAGKHVFCEKPLAVTMEQAEAMHEAWRASGRVFALGLVLRYAPLYRLARQWVAEGRIGKIISFEFNETLDFNLGGYIFGNWRRLRKNAGPYLLEKCCHDMDLALWITGGAPARVASFGGCAFFTPENASLPSRLGQSPEGRRAYGGIADPHGLDPFTSDKDIVDHQVALIEFQGGVRATFHTNCNAAIPERRFYILGSEGALRADSCTGLLELRKIGWNEPTLVERVGGTDGHGGADEPMAQALAECLDGRRAADAGFGEGLRSLALAHAIDQARETGAVVDVAPLWKRIQSLRDPS